ncbi:MAG: FN3 associated domain-containing protein [Patescibacteria group bacterium]
MNNSKKLILSGFFSLVLLSLSLLGTNFSAQAAANFNNNLKIGNVNSDVKALQKYLNAQGTPVALSGVGAPGQETNYFGPATKAALIKFQKANKISPASGFFGPLTRGFINKSLSPSITNPVASPVVSPALSPVINPVSGQYSIGGNITGISGPVLLQNNGGDGITINNGDNSNFTFPKKLNTGDNYLVTAISKLAGQNCYLNANSGVVNGANIDNIKIACGQNLYFNPFTFVPSSGRPLIVPPKNDALLSVSFSPAASLIPVYFQKVGESATIGTPVTLTSTPAADADIYYTTDGSDPGTLSPKYSSPIYVNADATIKATAWKSDYSNFATVSSNYKINQSAKGLFSNPHGTVRAGNKFFIGGRTDPATITVFNNPDDLSDSQTVTLTGHANLEYLIYDSVHDQLYASCYDGVAYVSPLKMTILRINPNNIADWEILYNGPLYTGWSPPIVTDGTYIYGATFNYNPAQFFKIRISDGVLVAQRGWGTAPNKVYYPHAATLVNYSGRSEMYVSSVFDAPNRFAKVSLTDLTYTSVSLGTNSYLTDDMACRYLDETGAMCYMGTDDGSATPMGYKVDTRTMATSTFALGGANSYGTFVKDNDLYVLGINHTITRYKNFDTAAPEVFSTPDITPNEMFYAADGKMFITDWNASSSLVQFELTP